MIKALATQELCDPKELTHKVSQRNRLASLLCYQLWNKENIIFELSNTDNENRDYNH